MFSVFIEMVIRNAEKARSRDLTLWHTAMVLSSVFTFINYFFLDFITYSVLILHICTLIQPRVLFLDFRYWE